MEKLQVDSNTDSSYFPGLESVDTLPSPAHASRTLFSLRFDQFTTAAEVIGDFLAAAAGVIGAYSAYHILGLGKGVLYPIPIVLGAASVFALLFVTMLDREGVGRNDSIRCDACRNRHFHARVGCRAAKLEGIKSIRFSI